MSKTTWRDGSAWRVTIEDGRVGLAACVLDTGTTGVTEVGGVRSVGVALVDVMQGVTGAGCEGVTDV